ncbi:helicase-associated domain-containing protein, partial [Corynebacterium sp. 1222RC1]|uniref:helicase-associated domain-containing protein n=1 Tax=Corynebacterium sp. 1222RC1 TaxID=2968464 RepID=UPI00211BE3DD
CIRDRHTNTPNTTNSVRLLSPESVSEQLPALRRTIIAGARQAPGSVGTLFRFQNPLLSLRVEDGLLEGVLGEARWLGVLGAKNEPTDVLDVLRAEPIAALQKDLEALLPADLVAFTQRHTPGIVEQLVPQGDMTVLAPGPLPAALAQSLALIAERESMGIATLYRLSAASIRRGLDAGMSSQEILGVLEQHTLGEVPSSMRYLIEAESKQHGQVRGGVALSYITSQDPSTITALCNSPAAETTGLQQLAPTVAVAQVPLLQVIRAAAQAGVHVVAQDSHGASIAMRPTPSVVPTPRPSSSSDKHARAEQAVERAVQALLTDRERTDATASVRNLSRSQTPLEALQEAIRTQQSVKLGFVDRSGAASFTKVTPIALASGQLSALNEATGAVEHFLLHRITEVSFA